MSNSDKQQDLPDYEKTVFIPAEDIRVIERVLDNWEQVKQEYCKIEAENKPSDDGESEAKN